MFEGAAYVFIAICFGMAGGIVGSLKGSSFWIWFLVSAIVPFVGLLAALCFRSELAEPQAPCPTCGKPVKLHQALCTKCGTELAYHAPGDLVTAAPGAAPPPRTPW